MQMPIPEPETRKKMLVNAVLAAACGVGLLSSATVEPAAARTITGCGVDRYVCREGCSSTLSQSSTASPPRPEDVRSCRARCERNFHKCTVTAKEDITGAQPPPRAEKTQLPNPRHGGQLVRVHQ